MGKAIRVEAKVHPRTIMAEGILINRFKPLFIKIEAKTSPTPIREAKSIFYERRLLKY